MSVISHSCSIHSLSTRIFIHTAQVFRLREGRQVQEPLSSAYLVIQQGSQAGRRVEIYKDHTTLGRSRDCDIFLEDVTVHRKQASIIYTRAGYVLRDEHGSGDSLVNGRPVREQLLSDGDHLLFGTTQLIWCVAKTYDRTQRVESDPSRCV